MDGTLNNGETGIDCGGGGCPDCGMYYVCVTFSIICYYTLSNIFLHDYIMPCNVFITLYYLQKK